MKKDVKRPYALAMCDKHNTVYYYRTKADRTEARKILKNFYPNLKNIK